MVQLWSSCDGFFMGPGLSRSMVYLCLFVVYEGSSSCTHSLSFSPGPINQFLFQLYLFTSSLHFLCILLQYLFLLLLYSILSFSTSFNLYLYSFTFFASSSSRATVFSIFYNSSSFLYLYLMLWEMEGKERRCREWEVLDIDKEGKRDKMEAGEN